MVLDVVSEILCLQKQRDLFRQQELRIVFNDEVEGLPKTNSALGVRLKECFQLGQFDLRF